MHKREFLVFISILILTLLSVSVNVSFAADVCGRTAQINYQDVLVDAGSSKKGEGLRFYLQKDEEARKFLDEYQSKVKPRWHNAAIGTAGTGLILLGIGKSGKLIGGENTKDVKEKRILILSGLAVLIVNYLIIKTVERNNEKLLLRSIEEYNKRNLPKIYFSPFGEKRSDLINNSDLDLGFNSFHRSDDRGNNALSWGVTLGLVKEF